MPSAKEIKSRIASIKDTQKITNAMYLISSTKLRKAKNELNRTRPYFDALKGEIKRIFRTSIPRRIRRCTAHAKSAISCWNATTMASSRNCSLSIPI